MEQKLLELKKKMNKKRPKFLRQDYYFRLKVHDEYWRRPRGYHSKMPRGEAGKRAVVQAGYRSPVAVRGLNLRGLKPVRIETRAQLEKIDAKKEIAIIASNLGLKKKLQLLKYAAEKNMLIANIKDAKKFLADAEAQLKARKEAKSAAAAKEKEKKSKDEKKPEKKTETQPEAKASETKEAKPQAETKQVK